MEVLQHGSSEVPMIVFVGIFDAFCLPQLPATHICAPLNATRWAAARILQESLDSDVPWFKCFEPDLKPTFCAMQMI